MSLVDGFKYKNSHPDFEFSTKVLILFKKNCLHIHLNSVTNVNEGYNF